MDLLNKMEKEMTSDIQKVLRTLNVFSVSEVTESVLIAKLHKNPMAKIVISLLNLVEQNIELCKCAAGKIDEMKSEKIAEQKQLIDMQQGQIDSVQETVKTEMKSWTDVVKKNSNQRQGKQISSENTIKHAVRSVNEEERKSKNVMIYGCEEKENEADFEVQKAVKDIFNATHMFPFVNVCDLYRIGKKEPGKSRPIKAILESASDVANVLFHARNLKEREKFKHVYLGPDRTKQDQLAHNRLVKEMKLMIEKEGRREEGGGRKEGVGEVYAWMMQDEDSREGKRR